MIDIGNDINEYPSNKLSNFEEYHFFIDGIECSSMEGFLQSLKFENPETQQNVCLLFGKKAKFKGKKKKWYLTQILYWMGNPINRHSEEYQVLLDKAFQCLSANIDFQKVLLDTSNELLKHSIGKSDPYRTILTEEEFCSRLMMIREKMKLTGDI